MQIPQRASGRALLHIAIAAVVFVLFGSLALRHVGESVFLSDQADQLQFFELFLRFDVKGLWGPIMSSPNPPTRTFGPLVAWLFGIPVAMGFGVDAVQAVTSLLLVASTAIAFAVLARLDLRVAWLWLLVMFGNAILWWNAGILWGNTLLLPLGNLLLACMAACLYRPTLAGWLGIPLVVLFAMHTSLVAITAVPPALVAMARTSGRSWARPPRGGMAALLLGLAFIGVAPYLIAEARTGFANTSAMLAHADGNDAGDTPPREYALAVLEHAADPSWMLRRAALPRPTLLAAGVALAIGALVLGAFHLRREGDAEARQRARAILWLVVCALVAIAAQAAFFMAQRRSLLSYHYVSTLLPLYAMPPAACLGWLAALLPARGREAATVALAAGCLAVIWTRGPQLADGYFERTDWTYSRIAAAVDELCESGAAGTAEGPGFDSVMPDHDGVVTYLMTRRFVRCRYDGASERLIVASREGGYPPLRDGPDGTFRLVRVVDPGLALYRREGGAPNQ